MKLLTVRINPDFPSDVEVHLELMAALRAVAWMVFRESIMLLLGAALYRNYLYWTLR
jgi:hypothetical protein